MQPFRHFCPFQFCFFDHFACVIARSIHFGTGVYFYWNFTISLPFSLINLFCTRYTKLFLSGPFGQKQMVPFFQVWPIKQILALFLFSASLYYRAKWKNNAAIIVWVRWYGCQSVVCMCHKKKCVWSSSSTLTESIYIWILPYTQRHCHVRIEKGPVQTVAIKLEAHNSLEYHYMLKH